MDTHGTAIVKFCVVRHQGCGLGLVMSVDKGRATVLFDGEENSATQEVSLTALTRVVLHGRVLRWHDKRVGYITGPGKSDPPSWKVVFDPLRGEEEIQEAALRPAAATDPYERALSGEALGNAGQTILVTASHHLMTQHNNNELVSLGVARVDVMPHQVSVVHRVISNPPHRFLLSDEVGLGKTIEAGMIIKELLARGLVKRILIVVPANLRRQWQFELKSKFNEVFPILDSATAKFLANDGKGGNPFSRDGMDRFIVSESWIVQDGVREQALSADWDLLIVDEAHHARKHRDGKQTGLYRFVKELTDRTRDSSLAVLFLTATPMQLNTEELYSLIEMLDPTLFSSEDDFSKFRKKLPELNQLVKKLSESNSLSDLSEFELERIRAWVALSSDEFDLLLNSNDVTRAVELLSREHKIAEILIRNRKAKVGENLPRKAFRLEVELSEEERKVLDAIEEYVDAGLRQAGTQASNQLGFRMTNYQKMLASSLRAIRDSLANRVEILQGGATAELQQKDSEDLNALYVDLETEGSFSTGFDFGVALQSDADEVDVLKRIIALADGVKVDSKAKVLVEKMEEFKNLETPKVIIFTGYLGTQSYLAGVLAENGWTVNLFNGSQSIDQKDKSVERFRTESGPQVLISTEAGAEGRNFQFCHVLVNYDLPWNPMVVEQRIGRVDRIGQSQIVLIFNLCIKDSIEERILNVLENRINMFEETVGGLDPILGEVADDVRSIMRKAREDRPKALEQLGERLQGEVEEARRANERLQDLIMDTKSFSVGIAERLLGHKGDIEVEVQEEFMMALLRSQGTYMTRVPNLKEYSVVFHDPLLGNHPELFKDSEDRKRRVVFRADERVDSELVQYFAIGHPVVDAILRDVTTSTWSGAAGSRRLTTAGDLPETSGWFFLYEVTTPDIRTTTRLLPVFVPDEGAVDEELGWKLVIRTISVDALKMQSSEVNAPVGAEQKALLPRARDLAERLVRAEVARETERIQATAAQRVDREIGRYRNLFAYKAAQCEKRIGQIEKSLTDVRLSAATEQQKIIPALESNLKRAQEIRRGLDAELAGHEERLNLLRAPFCSERLVQVARIEIVAP